MIVINRASLDALLDPVTVVGLMREALMAHARGDCVMPMPMHLDLPGDGEVHVKSCYRRDGKHFVLKMAGTFPENRAQGLSTGNGMMLLCDASTGAPVGLFEDNGYLTDYRTAAAAAAVAHGMRRQDTTLGILGTGIQARLQAQLHAAVLPLKLIVLWGRTPDRVAECAYDLGEELGVEVSTVATPAEVAKKCKLIVTCTGSRGPLLMAGALQEGTHISAVGSDGVGKQELYPGIVKRAALILADSRAQCEKFGELQHSPGEVQRAIEAGAFMESPTEWDASGVTVCDFTGLGVEDLYIAEHVFERSVA